MAKVATAVFSLALLLAPTLASFAPSAQADAFETTPSRLPFAVREAASATFGGKIYQFGGVSTGNMYRDEIVEFDPASGTTQIVARLPQPRAGMLAAAANGAIYLFGGYGNLCQPACQFNTAHRFDPTTRSLTQVAVAWELERCCGSVATDGRFVYLFGGTARTSANAQAIVRFDTHTHAVALMAAKLVGYNDGSCRETAAVWSGLYAYVMGGHCNAGGYDSMIRRYDPATDSLVLMGHLPRLKVNAAVASTGRYAYLLGGLSPSCPPGCPSAREVVRYDTQLNSAVVMAAQSRALFAATAGVANGAIYVLGGDDWNSPGYLDEIVRYRLVPGAPGALATAPGPGAGQITLGWTPPAANTYETLLGYRLYSSTSPSGPFSLLAQSASTSHVHSFLPAGATYHYKVAAYSPDGEGPATPVVAGTAPVVPNAPGGVTTSTGPQVGEVSLAWQAPSNTGGIALTGYKVYAFTSQGAHGPPAIVPPTQRNFTVAGLANGQTAHLNVAAINSVGEGPASAVVSVGAPVAPSAPRSLAATAIVDGATLTWLAPTSSGGLPVRGYAVYRGSTPNDAAQIARVATTSFADASLLPSERAFYSVRAFNDAGEGPATPETTAVAFALPFPPGNVRAIPVSQSQITIQWDAPANTGGSPLTGYSIYRVDGAWSHTLVGKTAPTTRSLTDVQIRPDFYSYYVTASTAVGESAASTVVPASAGSQQPASLSLSPGNTISYYVDGTTFTGLLGVPLVAGPYILTTTAATAANLMAGRFEIVRGPDAGEDPLALRTSRIGFTFRGASVGVDLESAPSSTASVDLLITSSKIGSALGNCGASELNATLSLQTSSSVGGVKGAIVGLGAEAFDTNGQNFLALGFYPPVANLERPSLTASLEGRCDDDANKRVYVKLDPRIAGPASSLSGRVSGVDIVASRLPTTIVAELEDRTVQEGPLAGWAGGIRHDGNDLSVSISGPSLGTLAVTDAPRRVGFSFSNRLPSPWAANPCERTSSLETLHLSASEPSNSFGAGFRYQNAFNGLTADARVERASRAEISMNASAKTLNAHLGFVAQMGEVNLGLAGCGKVTDLAVDRASALRLSTRASGGATEIDHAFHHAAGGDSRLDVDVGFWILQNVLQAGLGIERGVPANPDAYWATGQVGVGPAPLCALGPGGLGVLVMKDRPALWSCAGQLRLRLESLGA